jgi:NAD(P)H dehydrogenase (quinone)
LQAKTAYYSNCMKTHFQGKPMKAQIIFYSAHGHIYKMAKAIEQGVREVEGAEVSLYRLPDIGPDDSGAARAGFGHVPIARPERLAEADAIFFGTPTRFGNMCAPMRLFIDSAAPLWFSGALIGKVGSVFVSTAGQHGGQETTITSFHTSLFHYGMVIVGVPYSEKRMLSVDEVMGGSPYGASTISGMDGSRQPTENELAIARFQGKHVAGIAKKLCGK